MPQTTRLQTTRCCSRHLLILVLCNVGGSPRYDPGFNLILICVNYMSSNISSTLWMFADDTKVYGELSNIARDIETLQFGVYQLVSWATKWQLRFNFDKCEVLRITHKCDLSSLHTYWAWECIKDLGIMVSSGLSWSEHALMWPLIKPTNYWVWFTER